MKRLPRKPRPSAFTLTELLVVLAMAAILLLLQVPAWAGVKALTKREQCAGNLRQFALAAHLFANENNSRLPDVSAGYWPWDMPVPAADALLRYGATRTSLYCPDNPDQNALLWNFALPTFRVIGYAMTFNSPGVMPTNWNSSIIPQTIFAGIIAYPPPLPSSRVLLADATLSNSGQNNPALADTYQYMGIPGGFALPGWPGHRTSHLAGVIPEGGNLAMLDGHVEWRQFSAMLPRSSGGSPTFWW
jgi:prepilin-type N-terminal cleavage/methylation domain-containing protein/prepilin-type processing-associated H-X9-DG protein